MAEEKNIRAQAHEALLGAITKKAPTANTGQLRDLAEAYALATGHGPATIRGKLSS